VSQYASVTIPTLCSLGPRPFTMTGFLVQWLRAHFVSLANLTDRDLAQTNTQFLWTPSRSTELLIESYTNYDPVAIEKRPAVIVKRGSFRAQRLGINNQMMGTQTIDGQSQFGNAWLGTHSFFCLAGKGPETEKLAAEVFCELLEFSSEVRRTLNLLRFEVMEVGELAILEEASENFVVPVTVAYAFEHSWVLRPSSPRLRKIDLSVLAP
jgi:hypothetical protein